MDEGFIAFRLLAAEVEVAMYGAARIAKADHHPQQRHAVSPATNADQQMVIGTDEGISLDKVTDAMLEVFHAAKIRI